MNGPTMVIDMERCIGCQACVAACITENRREAAIQALNKGREAVMSLWLRTHIEAVPMKENSTVAYVHRICQHCEKSPCVTVCPTGASFKTENGIVLVDNEKCIGCQYCVSACPYGARTYDPYTEGIEKCTFCEHRLREGKLPACVETCPTEARIFGDLDDPNSVVSRRLSEKSDKVHQAALQFGTEPRVRYIVDKEEERSLLDQGLPGYFTGVDWLREAGKVAGPALLLLTGAAMAGQYALYRSNVGKKEGERKGGEEP